jgi:hypothetical protein
MATLPNTMAAAHLVERALARWPSAASVPAAFAVPSRRDPRGRRREIEEGDPASSSYKREKREAHGRWGRLARVRSCAGPARAGHVGPRPSGALAVWMDGHDATGGRLWRLI